jgi:mevalonate kinase
MAGDAATPALKRLGACANTLLKAWRRLDVPGVLAAASAAEGALDQLDEEFGLGIRHGGIAEARVAVETAGAVARTSGAGGGDCLWVLAKDAATLASAIDAAVNVGCTCPEVAWPSTGLEVRGC